MRFGVVVFPGTWSDCDFHYVVSEVLHQPVRYVWHRERDLSELNAIGIQLSAERNLDVLLETILTKAREITRSDGGSLYLVEESVDGPSRLRFAVAQCESVDIPFRTVSLPLDHKSVAGYVALTGAIVNLADAYTPPVDSPFQINRWFDDNAGYRTKSMLVVPMRTPRALTAFAASGSR